MQKQLYGRPSDNFKASVVVPHFLHVVHAVAVHHPLLHVQEIKVPLLHAGLLLRGQPVVHAPVNSVPGQRALVQGQLRGQRRSALRGHPHVAQLASLSQSGETHFVLPARPSRRAVPSIQVSI